MRYYAILNGRRTGVFNSWNECKELVKGFSGAVYKSFSNLEDAQNFLNRDSVSHRSILQANGSYLYVDAGQNRDTGNCSFASVVDHNGDDLVYHNLDLFNDLFLNQIQVSNKDRIIAVVRFDDGIKQQNNAGELIALVMGLRIALKNGIKIVYSDSELMVSYWSKSLKPKTRSEMHPDKLLYVEELMRLRIEYLNTGGEILKISGDLNLADLGRHK